jgi:hypothetical protein
LRVDENQRHHSAIGKGGRPMPFNGKHWVGTWAAAPAPAEGVVGFNNHTKRKSIKPGAATSVV